MAVWMTSAEMAAYLNARFTGGPAISNTELYMGFTTATPGPSGSFTNEPTSAGSYARLPIGATGTTKFGTTSNGVITNSEGALTFPTSSAAWSTGATPLTHWFIATSGTIGSGKMLYYGALTSPITVNAANLAPSFAPGQLSLTLQA